ncbi:MAG: hypothetical protein ABEK29_07945 [Bradymonadaceae bacterium]
MTAPDSSEADDARADTGTTDTAEMSDRDTDTGDRRSADTGVTDTQTADSGDTGTGRDTRNGGRDTGSVTDTATADTSPPDTTEPADTGQARDTAHDTSSKETRDTGTNAPDDTSSSDTRDTGVADSGRDTAVVADTGSTCGGTCGTNARCANGTCVCDSGYDGDPTGKCYQPKSCQSRSDCGSYTLCVGGKCICEPGFERKNSKSCTRPSVGDPSTRTKTEICNHWTSRTTNFTSTLWSTKPASQCATGTLKPIVQWKALEQTNVYRWLIGLDPVHAKDTYIATNHECATCLAAEGTLTHKIKSSFACYTQDAADGASSSNIASGSSHPAATVRRYIRDNNVASLGHRRWIFSPAMGATGFGHRGRYGCMWTLDNSGPDTQKDMYYPAPGSFPTAALTGPWSYLSADRLDTSNASVSITETATGNSVSVSNVNRLTYGGYGRVTGVSWEVPNATTGTEYKVTISGLGSNGSTTKSYKTTLVTCP